MTSDDLQQFADLLDKRADALRERAIIARAQKDVVGHEADEWATSFATAYQTLIGIAAAVREFAATPNVSGLSHTGGDRG